MKLYFPSLAVFFFACSSDKGVTVFNPNPEAQISSHSDGDEVLEGYVITFTGNVDDANHSAEELTTIWKSGSDVLCEATVANSDGTSVCEAVLTPDDTEITLEVKDAENAPGSDSISITVIPSENPVAEIITPEANGIYYSDQLITFEGLLSDEEDDAELLVALWESNRDGELTDVDAEPDSGGGILGYGYLTEGEHAIELTVEDTTGKTDRTSVIINVGPPNSAPLCDILSPEDGSAGLEGESVDFTASVSDVDVSASLLSVTWSSDKDGDIGSSTPDSAGNVSFPFADLSVNTHVISMIVTDEVGAECVANLNYTVGTPPSITIDAPVDGDTINEGSNITFSATVEDLQDQPDAVLLDWSLNGASFSTQGATSSGTAEFSDSSLAYGAYSLIVTATDSDGFTDSDQINFTINGLPTLPVLSINPDPASTNDTLTVNLDTPSTDPEGSTINYTYEWLLGGAVQSSYTSSTLPSSATSKNEQWTVRVTPNDGIADGPTGEATITIGNTAPTLSALAITPTTNIYNDSMLTCSVVVTDPDETLTPSYEWSIGSTIVGSGSTLDLSAAGAMPDDVVTCAASVTDGDGENASDSTTTIVANRVPLVSGITISPSTGISTAETLTCSATLSDADGETVVPTYEWSVGTSVLGSGDTLTLSPSSISPNDVLTCTISTEDGYGGNASDSTTVTINNTAPTIDSLVISPDSGVGRNTTLTCEGAASDVDGDALTESYEWTNTTQGTTLGTSETLSLNSSLANLSDDITCTYTVVDSWGETTSQSSSVMVESTAPTVDSVTVTPSSGAVGDVLTCVATASDLDGGQPTLSYSWSSAAGVIGAQDTLTLSASNSDVGETITCTATATDAQSLNDSGTATATVDNSVPTWNYVSIYTNPLYNYSEANCYAQVTDPDGPLSLSAYTFSWENTTTGTFLGTGASITLTSDDAMPGEVITCTGTADDGFVTITDTHSKTVGNSTPYVATVTISPSTPSNSDLVTCSATVNDADNETNISYTYRWRNDTQGVNLGMGSTLQLDSSMISSGEELLCHVTSEDAGGLKDTDYTTVTLSNTAPVIDSISISPSSPTEDTSALTCNVSASDADGDTVSLSYEWLVDTQPQTETTNMFTGPFVVGSIIACRVTPNDGKIDGSVEEDTATVANTPPVVDSLTLSPSTVYTNDTITATATVSDPDSGQTLSVFYEWHVIDSDTGVDGVPSSGYGVDTYTGFSRDDEVYVIVTANDNIDHSVPVTSSSITISNTPPSTPSISIETTTTSTVPTLELGFDHACVLYDSTIECWGDDNYGQSTPPSGSFKDLAVGNYHSCAININDEIECWGRDSHGEVSNVPSGTFQHITAGRYHSCAIDMNGYANCWGISGQSPSNGDFGQVDDVPTSVIFSEIDGGMFNTCGVEESGILNCWGDDRKDQLSDMPTDSGYSHVSVGNDHICALKSDATIRCWGTNPSNNSNDDGAVSDTPTSGTFLDVQAGYHHSCAVESDGSATCWGRNDHGQTSNTSSTFSVLSISHEVSCGITEVGQVECWGTSTNAVQNPPTISSTSVDSLVCSIDTESSDDDGDDIYYTYVWSDPDGTIQQTISDTLDLSDSYTDYPFAAGDWTCEVTPYDMSDYGTSASTIETVEQGCYSLEFDGSNDYISIADSSDFTLGSSDFTFEFWAKIGSGCSSTNTCSLLSHNNGSGQNDKWVLLYSESSGHGGTGFTMHVAPSSPQWFSLAQTTSIIDSWTHIAYVRSGSTLNLYLNGVHSGSSGFNSTMPDPNVDLVIGAAEGRFNFIGSMNAIKISDTAQYTSNFTPSTLLETDSNTITLWNMNAGSGSTLLDSSGLGHTGSINGPTWISSCPDE